MVKIHATFLPSKLRGEWFDARTKGFYAGMKSMKDNLRSYWVTETMRLLVIHWLNKPWWKIPTGIAVMTGIGTDDKKYNTWIN